MYRFVLAAVLTSCLLPSVSLRAQDAYFAQFFSSPSTLNPALTGLFPGRYRVAINHRSQWGQVLQTPYSTSAFAADFHYALKPKQRGSDAFGGGIYFLNDRMPEVGFASNQAMLSAAFHKTLDARGEKVLSIGGQAGVVQRSLGYGDLSFEDEFDGLTTFVPRSTREILPENSVAFGDYQLGLNYSRSPTRREIGYLVGLAVHHLTTPEQSFYAALTAEEDVQVTNTLYRRYSTYLNFRIPTNQNTEWSPRLYYTQQGPHAMLLLGSTVRLLTSDAASSAVHLGGWARAVKNQDGFGPESLTGLIGFEVSAFVFGLSYDVSLSPAERSRQFRGGLEFSVTYTGQSEEDEAVPCPKF
ncbi:hypothetical protein LEM8419_01568 [Neolewinella maritima]|uniref:Type IX secretion system membrane protein PorP/SprF n=1 Tax=Neolewinella maritima TaxID=1383882 RepID=A0ABM9B004_9BACT|nr:PorP/SprF family type IX secretion system membrane protein [Neolewinella maritima]CAH1000415.1 hypothetical protein LEM8419_01568 [Neolewinella maritima]